MAEQLRLEQLRRDSAAVDGNERLRATTSLPALDAGMTDGVWAALEAHEEELSALDGRFLEADESIPVLALDYLEGGEPAPTSTR